MWCSGGIELPNDALLRKTFRNGILIPFAEAFFELPCSSNKVGTVVTDDFQWLASPCHESRDCHHAGVCVQAVHGFDVNCPGDYSGEETTPVLGCLSEEGHFEGSEVNDPSVAERVHVLLQSLLRQVCHVRLKWL